MGHVKTDKLDNGNIGLEITYGGLESPFMGLHTGPPPAYVDPRCATAADGFLVIDNKLVLISLVQGTLPTLFQNQQPTPLKFGNFYDSVHGQLNYALGVAVTTPIGPPLVFGYKFYLTVWDTQGNIVDNQILSIQLWLNHITPVPATLTFPVIQGEPSDFVDSGLLGINYGTSNVLVGNVNVAYAPGDTLAGRVTALIAGLNAASASTLFTAAPTPDGFGIILTVVTAGVAGNDLCIADASGSTTPGLSPAFYVPFSQNSGTSGWTDLSGGVDATIIAPPASFLNVSSTAVGGVLYFANLGPMILKYSISSSTPGLQISSMYGGVKVIKKFAGSLIGLGVLPVLGQVVQNSNMIFAWSAANNLDEWAPVTGAGLVTGAGFAELADIDDQLIGLIVSNNTAFIVRSQGISYATALGSGIDPFQFAHISLGDNGEGCQNPELVCQYGETGAFVGNADIFRVAGGIQPIGARIKSLLFSTIQDDTLPLESYIYPAFLGGDQFPLLVFMIGATYFFFNTENETWMTATYSAGGTAPSNFFAAVFASQTGIDPTRVDYNGNLIFWFNNPGIPLYEIIPLQITEGYSAMDSTLSVQPTVTFPQEELLLGRDVTVDSLYIALNAEVTTGTLIEFFISGILYASYTMTAADFNLNGTPTEFQVFPGVAGVKTAHSPQLSYKVTVPTSGTAKLRFDKIQMYASFDPMQRPV